MSEPTHAVLDRPGRPDVMFNMLNIRKGCIYNHDQ